MAQEDQPEVIQGHCTSNICLYILDIVYVLRSAQLSSTHSLLLTCQKKSKVISDKRAELGSGWRSERGCAFCSCVAHVSREPAKIHISCTIETAKAHSFFSRFFTSPYTVKAGHYPSRIINMAGELRFRPPTLLYRPSTHCPFYLTAMWISHYPTSPH